MTSAVAQPMTVWKKVYKYPLALVDLQMIDMPWGARLLSVDVQRGSICLWAIVDTHPGAAKVQRRFRVVGTGHDFDHADDWHFLGTVQLAGGALVFHVFTEHTIDTKI